MDACVYGPPDRAKGIRLPPTIATRRVVGMRDSFGTGPVVRAVRLVVLTGSACGADRAGALVRTPLTL
ncbi:hypothetical protein GCM10020366_60830 [Saccharopolyspora gregorii]|uniref:Uncharacterized protein n=1 Tax=Saccharopolyspora gregorii TaxID=33914 RepID=A0ABP6S024_9PSEU